LCGRIELLFVAGILNIGSEQTPDLAARFDLDVNRVEKSVPNSAKLIEANRDLMKGCAHFGFMGKVHGWKCFVVESRDLS
jgi:hypothetical protein